MTDFQKFPSIPRYRKDIQITEKIDGTNAAIGIQPAINEDYTPNPLFGHAPREDCITDEAGNPVHVYAQSRSRIITPGKSTDNYGFAQYVRDNASNLYLLLGAGIHYGEWYGSGINRNYGLTERRFALFNTARYTTDSLYNNGVIDARTLRIDVVPTLYTGPAYYTPEGSHVPQDAVRNAMDALSITGSHLVPGFMNPEGVVIFHTASRQRYKATYDYDEGKWTAQ